MPDPPIDVTFTDAPDAEDPLRVFAEMTTHMVNGRVVVAYISQDDRVCFQVFEGTYEEMLKRALVNVARRLPADQAAIMMPRGCK